MYVKCIESDAFLIFRTLPGVEVLIRYNIITVLWNLTYCIVLSTHTKNMHFKQKL